MNKKHVRHADRTRTMKEKYHTPMHNLMITYRDSTRMHITSTFAHLNVYVLWVWRIAQDISLFTRVTSNEKILLVKQLASLITADVSLSESLHIIRENNHSRGLTITLQHVLSDVQNGKSLSRSLAKHPQVFGEYALGVIAIGEATGTLGQNLSYLADELRKRRDLRRKVASSLLYPVLITIATLMLTIFLVAYLFPKLMPIFLSLRMQLPLSTRLVIGTSQFLQHNGLLLIVAAFLFSAVVATLRRRSTWWKRMIAAILMKTPFLGKCIQQYNMAQGTRTLGLLLKSGMPISAALATLAPLTRSPLYREAWQNIAQAVDKGETISSQCRTSALFPSIATHMIAVGERSGDLSSSLLYVADTQEEELDTYTKMLSTLIEPALMICMGLLIGLIAISIITPIYGLTQHLQS